MTTRGCGRKRLPAMSARHLAVAAVLSCAVAGPGCTGRIGARPESVLPATDARRVGAFRGRGHHRAPSGARRGSPVARRVDGRRWRPRRPTGCRTGGPLQRDHLRRPRPLRHRLLCVRRGLRASRRQLHAVADRRPSITLANGGLRSLPLEPRRLERILRRGQCHVRSGDADPGRVDDAVRRLNFYRWLCGLGPVSADDDTNNTQAQLCAVTSAWNPAGYMAHTPDPSAICYTSEGAFGAGHSNIAWGVHSGPTMIDQFMIDRGNETTLGHRRWCLYPPLGQVGAGIYHGGGSGSGFYGGAACLKVMATGGGGSGSPRPDVVAYPPAGYVPVGLTTAMWSIAGGGLTGGVDVTITRGSDGTIMPVTVQGLDDGYGARTMAWSLDGWTPDASEDYQVEVTDGTSTVTYHVLPVQCG